VNTPPVDEQIRQLISSSPLSIREIAKQAKVDHQHLHRFMAGRTKSLNAVAAELVFYLFTGRTFTEPGKPLKKLAHLRGEERAA
jgi:hypothetical protein